MNATKSENPVKTLVILLNMGGPQNKDEVHPYLKELFQDREILKLPFQKVLGRYIAWRRTPNIQERYEEIGQYSPTKRIMDCLLYTSPSPRDRQKSRMPSSA